MRNPLGVIVAGLVVLALMSGPAGAQDMECTVITQIVGHKVTLTPENKDLQPFIIEAGDIEGLRVGDRVWVKDGKIVRCALPGRTPPPARKQ